MPKAKPVPAIKNKPAELTGVATAFQLQPKKTLTIDSADAVNAISVKDDAFELALALNGKIKLGGSDASAALSVSGIRSKVTTGAKSTIDSSGDGIRIADGAIDAALALGGKINAAGNGIVLSPAASGTEIVIRPKGDVTAVKTAILAGDLPETETLAIINGGTIKGAIAIDSTLAALKLVNTGTIIGDIKAGAAADWFNLSTGTVQGKVFGGAGDDVYLVSKQGNVDVIAENEGGGTDLVQANVTVTLGTAGKDRQIENVLLIGTAAIDATGNELANTITGNSAANKLDGGDGNDTLIGGEGIDTLVGGKGNDALVGGLGDDVIDGGEDGDYTSYAGAAAGVTIIIGTGIGTAAGGTVTETTFGKDTVKNVEYVRGSSYNDTITGSADKDTIEGGNGDDIINAGDNDDTPFGGDGNDTINGEAGNDIIYGGLGTDILSGGLGNDTINGGGGNNTINGDDGNDNLSGDTGFDTLNGGMGNDFLDGYSGNDTLTGGDGDDNISGREGDDNLSGGNGLDTLAGDAGNDTLIGEAGNDILRGGDGNDQMDGGTEDDILYGGNGIDTMMGGDGADVMNGDDGDDTISGGTGDDTVFGGAGRNILTGDAGADNFTFTFEDSDTLPTTYNDTITDFNVGADDLLFYGYGLGSGSATNYMEVALATNFNALITAADAALDGTVLYYVRAVTGGDVYLCIDADGDGISHVIRFQNADLTKLAFSDII